MLSIVIPTFNAARELPQCLASVGDAREIIVVDGGSADGTPQLAEAAGARVLKAPKGRGAQLQAGAEAANGDWLLFLHADTRLSAGWQDPTHKHMGADPSLAACFRFRLDDDSWQARLIEKGVAVRARLLGLPYGDQGLLASRTHYDRAGGYRPLPLLEDVDLVRRLGRVAVLEAHAITSAERWRRDGWVRRSSRNLFCLGLYGAGVRLERIARIYG